MLNLNIFFVVSAQIAQNANMHKCNGVIDFVIIRAWRGLFSTCFDGENDILRPQQSQLFQPYFIGLQLCRYCI